MSPDIQKRLKEFYNNLTDRPLEPGDRYYVPFLEGPGDPIRNLFTKIAWSEAASVALLTGQRGSGKSTELRRLKKLLTDGGCVVFLCDMSRFMNLTTAVEITDFFISVMGALSEEIERKYGQDPSMEGVLGTVLQLSEDRRSTREHQVRRRYRGVQGGTHGLPQG